MVGTIQLKRAIKTSTTTTNQNQNHARESSSEAELLLPSFRTQVRFCRN